MESLEYVRFIAALALVLGLLGGCAWIARRLGLTPGVVRAKAKAAARLEITEVLPIDARRRLLLVRRDNVEHLIIIGDSETVVETGIAVQKPGMVQ